MAPIKDETVDALRDLVNKLEARVEQLEAKVRQHDGSAPTRPAKSTESIRMILMGPPGAGMYYFMCTCFESPAESILCRQGYTSSQNQGKVSRMSFGKSAALGIHHIRCNIMLYRLLEICYGHKSQKRPSWDGKRRR